MIQPDEKQLKQFTKYLLKNYVYPDANFSLKLWSQLSFVQ